MNVARVEARTVVVPLDRPVRIARRLLDARHYTLVRVTAEDGTAGVGWSLAGAPASAIVRSSLAVRTVGADVFATERLWGELYHETLLQGRRGAAVRALSALDIALWDLKGKLLGASVAQLLGVYQDPVPAYASGGYYAAEGDPVRLVEEEATANAEAGYGAMKIKVGGAPLDVDVKRVEGFRRAVGEGPKLMLDANNAWSDWRSALAAFRRFEPFGIEWIEEPLMPDDIDGHRRLAERIDVAVAGGEIEATRWGFAQILRAEALDVLQADAAVAGGISEWRKIAETAASFDVPIAPHWFSDLHVHCVAAAPNGTWIEHFPDSSILNVTKLFERSLEVVEGRAAVPRESGLGVELKESAVDGFAADGWA